MLDQLLSSRPIRDNGKIVYDSNNHERTCVVFRHFHGSEGTAIRLLEEHKFRDAFFAHQTQVLKMAESLLKYTDASLIIEGMRTDRSRPSTSYLGEISAREEQKLVDPIDGFTNEQKRRWTMSELDLLLAELEDERAAQPKEGFFINHDLDQMLAGFRAAALVKSRKLSNQVEGIEPSLNELERIVLRVTGARSIFDSVDARFNEQITAEIQRAKNDAIVRGFMEGNVSTGVVIIGASHTRNGTPAPDLGLEAVEDLFQARQKQVRVVVIEPNTPAWNY